MLYRRSLSTFASYESMLSFALYRTHHSFIGGHTVERSLLLWLFIAVQIPRNCKSILDIGVDTVPLLWGEFQPALGLPQQEDREECNAIECMSLSS